MASKFGAAAPLAAVVARLSYLQISQSLGL
jgi:hypothetical protein